MDKFKSGHGVDVCYYLPVAIELQKIQSFFLQSFHSIQMPQEAPFFSGHRRYPSLNLASVWMSDGSFRPFIFIGVHPPCLHPSSYAPKSLYFEPAQEIWELCAFAGGIEWICCS
jgi:hypothetical protein